MTESYEVSLLTGQIIKATDWIKNPLFYLEDDIVYCSSNNISLDIDQVIDLLNKLATCGNGAIGCEHDCGYHPTYGFVPESGCPVHDREE